ncbi:MAG TPA: hypothetical protein VFX25_14245 [Streptosporangiaceae bacterium]|nr:hypothetical protein [Streptosporangiaceae bacterium]
MRYAFYVHRELPRWRLVLGGGGTFPERTSAEQWRQTRTRDEADTNPDVRAEVRRQGYCLFSISATFDDLDRELRPPCPG